LKIVRNYVFFLKRRYWICACVLDCAYWIHIALKKRKIWTSKKLDRL